jgi:hypothetical protein
MLCGGTTTLASEPVIRHNQNGKLEVFVRGSDNKLYHIIQQALGSSLWKWGSPLGGPVGGGIVAKPAVIRNDLGLLEVFVRGADNKLYRIVQGEQNIDDWSGWLSVDAAGTLASEPAVARNIDDTLEVFVKGTDNGLYHIRQISHSRVWGGWKPLGGILTSEPVVGQYGDGILDVFVRGADGELYHISQTAPGSRDWSVWAPLDGGLGG